MDIRERIANDFTYHSPREGQAEVFAEIRSRALDFARHIVDVVPPSREQSLALTSLEEVVFWANAGIARNS